MSHGIILSNTNLNGLDLKDKTAATGYNPVGFGEFIVLILIFIMVVAACYYVTKFIGNRQQRQLLKNSNFQVIDTYRLSQTKYLQLIKVGEQYIVLAITKDQISVVANLAKEEVNITTTAKDQQIPFHTLVSDLLNKKKNDGKG